MIKFFELCCCFEVTQIDHGRHTTYCIQFRWSSSAYSSRQRRRQSAAILKDASCQQLRWWNNHGIRECFMTFSSNTDYFAPRCCCIRLWGARCFLQRFLGARIDIFSFTASPLSSVDPSSACQALAVVLRVSPWTTMARQWEMDSKGEMTAARRDWILNKRQRILLLIYKIANWQTWKGCHPLSITP